MDAEVQNGHVVKEENKNEKTVESQSFWHSLIVDIITAFWFARLMLGFAVYPILMYYITFHTRFWFLGFIYFMWMYYDKDTPNTGGRKLKFREGTFSGKYAREYFPVDLIKIADLPPTKNYLFATFPHGMLCFGGSVNFLHDLGPFKQKYPGLNLYATTLASNFHCPIARELMMWNGLISVSERSILNLLNKEPNSGTVCNIVVGGAAEAFYAYPDDTYRLVLKKRKGFVRVALKAGVPLVPVFCFGENDIYDQYKGSWLYEIQEQLYRMTGYAPVIPKGRMIGHFNTGLPRRCPVNVVVGRPLDLPKIEDPTEEQVAEYHAKFKDELFKLFEEYKEQYDPRGKNAKLLYL